MKKQAICVLVALVALSGLSVSTYAATISYHGYTLDTDTNIVTGGGLEWLQWDETIGLSINQALSTYGLEGWRLASNNEMSALFNAFDLGFTFTGDENTEQAYRTERTIEPSPITEHDVQFVTIFGETYLNHIFSTGGPDPIMQAAALYGADQDGDGLYNRATLYDDQVDYFDEFGNVLEEPYHLQGYVALWSDRSYLSANYSIFDLGVALVRSSEVPVPGAIWLLGSGLAGLVGLRRAKK